MSILQRRLAFVDDDSEIADAYSKILRAHYDVTVFESSKAFLKMLSESSQCPFDIILTDLNMPELSGIEMMRSIQELGFQIPAVAFSGYLDKEACLELNKCGVYRLVEKPAPVADLLGCLEEVLRLRHRRVKLMQLSQSLRRLREVFDATHLLWASAIPEENPLERSFLSLDGVMNGLFSDIEKLNVDENEYWELLNSAKQK